MKLTSTHLFFVFSVLLSMPSFAQSSFRTGIKGFTYNGLYDAVQLNDGSYVAVGYADIETPTDDSNYAYIVKLNATGEVIASRGILGDVAGYSDAVDIIKTTDGNIAVSGSLNDQIALYKYDTNLNLIWFKQYYANTDYGYATRLLQSADGGFMIAGYVENYDAGVGYSDGGCLVKTTGDGSLSWVKRYFALQDSYIIDIVKTTDNNYAFLASSYSATSGVLDTTYVVKINSSGTVLWAKYLSTTIPDQDAISLLVASDGGLVVSGTINKSYNIGGNDYSLSQAMMFKLDQNGNLVWAKAGDNNALQEVYLWGLVQDSDGGFVASGQNYSADLATGNYNTAAYLMKVNSSGTLVWTKTYSDGNIENYGNGLLRTSDGGYAMAGEAYNVSAEEAYGVLYKFNSAFNICGEAAAFGNLTDLPAAMQAKTLTVTTLSGTVINDDIAQTTTGAGVNVCNLLPVQLLSFSAALQNKAVNLQWKTSNEINTDYFVVERSPNSIAFSMLEKVAATGGSAIKTYSASDMHPLSGTSYYRLKGVDKDGSITYSNIVPVTVSANGSMVISPNPVHNTVRLVIQSQSAAPATFIISDMTGKRLASQKATLTIGINNISLPAASLSKGLYLLKVVQNNTVQTMKFVKE